MYSEAMVIADETLAESVRVRAEAADQRARSSALLLKYRRQRFSRISGGSDTDNGDRVRLLLRDFCATNGTPKSYVGYSRGAVCHACASTISAGEIEYELVTPGAELRLDEPCYAIFMDVQSTSPGTAAS